MAAPAWFDELVLEPGPPWHAMGTRALDPSAWLVVDGERDAQLARKRRLLAEHHNVVAGALPGSEAACAEAAALVGAADLVSAALAVQEDLCVLTECDGRWCLTAGVVCFPSMWSLAEKLGRPMDEVHGPVPAYAGEMAERVDRFLDRLRPDRPVWRRNWFVHDSPELHLPTPPVHLPSPTVPDDLWLRSERQTLRRLPSGILFTIRTQQVPFSEVGGRPDVALRMAVAMRSWSPALIEYRGAAAWLPVALDWLDRVA